LAADAFISKITAVAYERAGGLSKIVAVDYVVQGSMTLSWQSESLYLDNGTF